MTPIQTAQTAASVETREENAFQKVSVLSINCKTIRTLLVESIFKRKPRFTQEELEEAKEVWMRG